MSSASRAGAAPRAPRRLLVIALLAVFTILQVQLWFGSGGVVALQRTKGVLERVTALNDTAHKRNAVEAADVADLGKNGAAVEARARSELGMIHKGETFYLVVGPQR